MGRPRNKNGRGVRMCVSPRFASALHQIKKSYNLVGQTKSYYQLTDEMAESLAKTGKRRR